MDPFFRYRVKGDARKQRRFFIRDRGTVAVFEIHDSEIALDRQDRKDLRGAIDRMVVEGVLEPVP